MQSTELLFEQARDALRNQEPVLARDLCAEALKQAPDDLRLMMLHGFALRRLGEHDKAEPLLRAVLRADPSVDLVHHELGQALVGLGRLAEARISLERAVGLNPELVPAWRDLYEVHAAEGNDVAAAEAYRQSMRNKKLDPLLQKAIESVGQGRLGIAEAICREYLKRRPHDVDAIRLLAEVGLAVGLAAEAILLLERCLELAPGFHVARANYVTALARFQRFEDALRENETLRRQQPDNLSHQVQFATTLSMAGRFEEAHEAFAKALERAPTSERILTSYGHSLRYGGKGDEAIAVYLRAIAAKPSAGEAYWSLANLKTFRFDDSQFADMQSQYGALPRPSEDKYHLAFAVGKAFEDRKEYDPSFAAYAEGNAIKRQFSGYDAEKTTGRVDRLISHCGTDLWNDGGHPSDEAIFIVGLPRAGSTLLEQILAAHPRFSPLGESDFWPRQIAHMGGRMVIPGQQPRPADLPALRRSFDAMVASRRLAPGTRLTDKRPDNLFHIASLARVLPEARFVITERDWRDTLVSVFGTRLHAQHGYATSVYGIRDHLRLCRALADRWEAVSPERITRVRYEDVISAPEATLKALLGWLGEPWDAACLDFHKLDNPVRTASVWQVRQPLSANRQGRWRRYESQLRDLLGSCLDDEWP